MFSRDIVGSDAFQDMPASSQLLYFHLGMEADDDGFIGNPKRVARGIGMAEDDMKILVAKRFVLLFQSGVLVIKHHRINNNWDKYNCKRTMYVEEFSQLYIKPNKAYTTDKTQGIALQSENSLKTVFRIEEKRIDKNRIEEKKEASPRYLTNIPVEDLEEFKKRFDAYESDIESKGESLALYCEAKGKKYKNYRALLLNALKKDFKPRPPKIEKPPEIPISEEDRKNNLKKLADLKKGMFKGSPNKS